MTSALRNWRESQYDVCYAEEKLQSRLESRIGKVDAKLQQLRATRAAQLRARGGIGDGGRGTRELAPC